MPYYWVKFKEHKPGTIRAEDYSDAKVVANEYNDPISIKEIPYPASPILDDSITCPPFCHTPDFCSGCSSCPKNPSCSE